MGCILAHLCVSDTLQEVVPGLVQGLQHICIDKVLCLGVQRGGWSKAGILPCSQSMV